MKTILFRKTRENPYRMTRNILLATILCSSLVANSQSIDSNTDSADLYLQKGLQEKKIGRNMEAIKHLEKAYQFEQRNRTILAAIASTNMDLRNYAKAKENYKQLVVLGDESVATYKQLLNLSFHLKHSDDVVHYAGLLKKADPSEPVAYYIGKVEYDRENYGEALRQLNIASKEDPKNAEVPYMIAHSYADMQNYKQSIPFFQQAIALDSTKNNWIYELSLIYYALQDDKNSLKYMLLAGEKGYKKDNEYWENLGIAYLNAGQLDQGVAILDQILIKRPSDINILNMVAEAYYFNGKYQKAIDYWDQVLTYDKENASALYMIGMSYQKKGEKEKGVRLCDKAIEMDPSLGNLKQKKQLPGF